MKCWINNDRHFSHINAIVHVHTEHSRDSLFDCSLTAENFDHRSIQPYTFQSTRNFYAAAFFALTDNTGSIYVTSFKRMDICFSVCIDKLCANGTNLFCYQSTHNLRRIDCSCWMILDRILIKKGSTCSVSKYKSVCSCTVVVRCGESLIMHSSCTTCCDYNCFCSCNRIISCFHVKENCTCNLSFFIFEKFHSGSKLNYRDTKIDHFVSDSTHNLRSGIILSSMHSLSGSTAAVCGNHSSVFCFIKFNTKVIKPLNGIRSFHYQSLYKFRFCCKMSAAEAVQIMLYRRIILFICSLDTALCHHCVGITDTKLCNDHNVCTCIVCFNGTGRTCTATADHKYVYVIINFCKVNLFVDQTAC